MIYELTYNDRKIQYEIDQLVGKKFSILQRLKMKGNGSPSLVINESSLEITKLLSNGVDTKNANIELRPQGIIVGFKNGRRVYAWVIPYYYLQVYGSGYRLNIYGNKHKLKLEDLYKTDELRKFTRKLMEMKAKINFIDN